MGQTKWGVLGRNRKLATRPGPFGAPIVYSTSRCLDALENLVFERFVEILCEALGMPILAIDDLDIAKLDVNLLDCFVAK